MRRRALALSVGLLLGVAACALAPNPATIQPASAGPAPLADHDWFLSLETERPALMYGAQNSDDIWMVLTCTPGAGVLDLTQPAVEMHPIQLESGGDTETYPAKTQPSDLHDLLLTARARATEPVFQRFRRIGWLATWTDGRRAVMVPQPGSVGRVETFFAACESSTD